MTEPDEALLWARRQKGLRPSMQVAMAIAYRAGAAASDARIKALEEALRELIEYPDDMLPTRLWDNARALLKETDQ